MSLMPEGPPPIRAILSSKTAAPVGPCARSFAGIYAEGFATRVGPPRRASGLRLSAFYSGVGDSSQRGTWRRIHRVMYTPESEEPATTSNMNPQAHRSKGSTPKSPRSGV